LEAARLLSWMPWRRRGALRLYERLGAHRPHEWIKYALEGEELESLARKAAL